MTGPGKRWADAGARRRKALEAWAREQLKSRMPPTMGSSYMSRIEMECILRALTREGGSLELASERIGLSVSTFRNRLRDWGFDFRAAGREKR